MNSTTLESFINFCDKMQIAKESVDNNTTNLSGTQIARATKLLNEKYEKIIASIYKKSIAKYSKLKKVGYYDGVWFDYDQGEECFKSVIAIIQTYPDKFGEHCGKAELIRMAKEYKKDLQAFEKDMNSLVPKDSGIDIAIYDEVDRFNIDKFVQYMINFINKNEYADNCGITVFVKIPISKCTSLIPSENDIKESERRYYINFYEEFIKFLQHPHKLSGDFWSGTLADIAKLMDFSSEKMNRIVSKNFRPIGTPFVIDAHKFDDPEYGKTVSKNLGKCYMIDDRIGGDIYLVYSENRKKLYWVSYEHCDCITFYNKFPFKSEDFEDIVDVTYGDNYIKNRRKKVISFFKDYNKEHDIHIFD